MATTSPIVIRRAFIFGEVVGVDLDAASLDRRIDGGEEPVLGTRHH